MSHPHPLKSDHTAPDPEGRRKFIRESLAGIAILTATAAVPRLGHDPEYEVVRQTIRLPNLSAKHDGLTIGVISDIHSGPHMSKEEMQSVVEGLQELNPDIVLLPGDFIQSRNEEIKPVCEILCRLRAPYGVFGCLGNHDYFTDAEFIAKELENANVVLLRNQHRVLYPGGDPIALSGIDDVRKGYPFDLLFSQAVGGLDSSIPNILLCHKQYYFEEAAEWGVNLMVSGHTHGGQIVLARIFNTLITPASLFSGYVAGLYALDSSQLYVTRGIGTVGLPYRLNCPPEITLLTLKA